MATTIGWFNGSRGFKFAPDDPPPGGGDPAKPVEPAKPADPPESTKDVATLEAMLEAERKKNQATEAAKAKAEKEAADLRAARDADDRKKLEEEGKFKELAKKESDRADDHKREMERAQREAEGVRVDAALQVELIREGIQDLDLGMLIDKTNVKFENGRVVGVAEAVKAFKEQKPHFFGTPKVVISTSRSAANPGTPAPTDDKPVIDVSREKMTDEEYKKYKDKTLRAIYGGRGRSAA